MEKYFETAFELPMSRRTLIKGIAAAGAATWAGGLTGTALGRGNGGGSFKHFRAIPPSSADELQVPDGYVVDVVIKWGDEFADGLTFGYNCDYSAWFPFRGKGDEGLMWVNHEYLTPFFTSDWVAAQDPTWDPRAEPFRSIMENEKKQVGGSILHLRRRKKGPWEVVHGSPFSRRFYGDGPPVPYDGPVAGTSLAPSDNRALGTLANCSGATTPWGTVLSCEENHQSYGLERRMPFQLGWIKGEGLTEETQNFYVGEPGLNADHEPVEDNWPFYGYVAEIDPFTGKAVKHTALGRIHHENVGLRVARGGTVVCYTGDDAPAADGMFFKFVSSRRYRRGMGRSEAMKILSEGQLYVAQWFPQSNDPTVDRGTGVWHPLDMGDPEALAFTTRWIEEHIVPDEGGNLAQFRVPRAEDCEVVKADERQVLISLTSARGRLTDPTAYGVVRLLREDTFDPHSRSFRWVDLLEGGEETGFSNPDNLGFGKTSHDLWVVTDISTSRINVDPNFAWHGNNAIFYVPLRGRNAHTAFRFANAPVEAELTGPTFAHHEKTLFLNVQHPGEETPNRGGVVDMPATYTSWWPEGNKTAGTNPSTPKASLVAIRKL